MFERASFHSAEWDYYYETAKKSVERYMRTSSEWTKRDVYNMITKRMNDFGLDRTAIAIMRGQRRREKSVECVQGCKIDRYQLYNRLGLGSWKTRRDGRGL